MVVLQQENIKIGEKEKKIFNFVDKRHIVSM